MLISTLNRLQPPYGYKSIRIHSHPNILAVKKCPSSCIKIIVLKIIIDLKYPVNADNANKK